MVLLRPSDASAVPALVLEAGSAGTVLVFHGAQPVLEPSPRPPPCCDAVAPHRASAPRAFVLLRLTWHVRFAVRSPQHTVSFLLRLSTTCSVDLNPKESLVGVAVLELRPPHAHGHPDL